MLRPVLRKSMSIATGVVFASTVLTGALAYDLGTYPAKYISDGKFDGSIVIGAQANAKDVLGAIDIAGSLQAGSVSKVVPLYHGEVLSGDAKGLNGGKMQIRKKPTPTLTQNDVKAFARGRIENAYGATDYDQFMRVGATGLQQITSNYIVNNDNNLTDYFVLGSSAPFFEWEERFNDGFKSKRDSDGILHGYDDEGIGIVGMKANIVSARISATGTEFSMTLMGGSVGDTLREGQTKTYSVGGKDYEVTLVFVSDPASSGEPEVKFSVNGEITHALSAGNTDVLADGLQIGVREILVNNRAGAASFYLGARKITFSDPTPTSEDFDGTVEVNGQNIPHGQVQVMGNFDTTNSTFRMAWIKYRYTADPLGGSTVYMPQNGLLRQYLRRPEGMLSDIDFHYHGLVPAETKNMSITKDGEDQYRMTFSNTDGTKYDFPLLSNRDGVWKYGDDKDDLIFAEGANGATQNIGINDYFVLTNSRTGNDADKAITHVLRYTDYDPSALTLYFERESDRQIIKVPVSSGGIGYLIAGAYMHKVNVSDPTASRPTIGIDLDANGAYGNTVKVVTWGGVIVNLAQNVVLNSTTNASLSSNVGLITGNGVHISDVPGFSSGAVQMNAQVLAKKFDTPTTDETFNWTITRSGTKVDLSMVDTDYDGPLSTDFSDDNTGYLFRNVNGDSYYTRGLTDWGILIQKYSPSDHPSELKLNIPQTQRYTQMFVSVGKVIHGGLPAGTEKVNPIGVGIAMTDEHAPAFGEENLIVVGGPCANKLAAELLGTGDDCSAGFEPGEGMIRAWDKGDKVAILISGYSADDTLGASRVLAAYKSYKLTGDQVQVVTTDLADLKVQ